MRVKFLLFLCAVLFWSTACFASGLSLEIVVPQGQEFVSPADQTVTIRYKPVSLSVLLANHSSSPQSVYWENETGGMSSLSFEMTDENGKTFMVKHKGFESSSQMALNNYLQVGQGITKTVILDPNRWENVPKIESNTVKRYRVRAAFYNNGVTIYSDYYTIIFDGR